MNPCFLTRLLSPSRGSNEDRSLLKGTALCCARCMFAKYASVPPAFRLLSFFFVEVLTVCRNAPPSPSGDGRSNVAPCIERPFSI